MQFTWRRSGPRRTEPDNRVTPDTGSRVRAERRAGLALFISIGRLRELGLRLELDNQLSHHPASS